MPQIPDLSRVPERDPIEMLRKTLEALHDTNKVIAQGVVQIATNTAAPANHRYTLEQTAPGTWLVYCFACSEAEHRFVFPCLNHTDVPVEHLPPRMIDTNP